MRLCLAGPGVKPSGFVRWACDPATPLDSQLDRPLLPSAPHGTLTASPHSFTTWPPGRLCRRHRRLRLSDLGFDLGPQRLVAGVAASIALRCCAWTCGPYARGTCGTYETCGTCSAPGGAPAPCGEEFAASAGWEERVGPDCLSSGSSGWVATIGMQDAYARQTRPPVPQWPSWCKEAWWWCAPAAGPARTHHVSTLATVG